MGRSAPRDDMFNFDESLSVSAKRGDGDSGTVMYVIGGVVGLAVVVFIVFGVFHQLKARKRYKKTCTQLKASEKDNLKVEL